MKKIIKITIIITITVVCTLFALSIFGGVVSGLITGIFHSMPSGEDKQIKARTDIVAMETSLKIYRLDNGNYPTTEQGLLALVERPESKPIPKKWVTDGYLEKKKVPKDPWGREYLYLSPGIYGEYDIISYGADGAPGGQGSDQDINSWEIY